MANLRETKTMVIDIRTENPTQSAPRHLPICPFFTSSAARSISTHSDQITQMAAPQWNSTVQNSLRLSTPDISKLSHWNGKNETLHITNLRVKTPARQHTHLIERLDLRVHNERKLAQLARVRLGRRQPLLQARLVHVLEAAGAIARRQQRIVQITLAVADATDVAAALRRLAAARAVAVWHFGIGEGTEKYTMIMIIVINGQWSIYKQT